MTTQISDRISIDGGPLLPLHGEPLTPWLAAAGWEFCSYSSACWRGHVATWAVRDERLWLADLAKDPFAPVRGKQRRKQKGKPSSRGPTVLRGGREVEVGLADLFPGSPPPILASWVSGTLRVPFGAVLRPEPEGFPVYEEELLLEIEEGRLLRQSVRDNRAPQP